MLLRQYCVCGCSQKVLSVFAWFPGLHSQLTLHDAPHRRLSYHPPWWYHCYTLPAEVCHNVATKLSLQPLWDEILNHHSANRKDGAQFDIRARGFWNRTQDAFFDVRTFHPNASSYGSMSLQAAFHCHKQAKKRECGEHVRELVEHSVFAPLVLSATGSLGCEATAFYKCLADLISSKQQKHHTNVTCWLRCWLAFSILQSAIMCVRHPTIAQDVRSTSPSEGLLTQ